MSKQPWFKFYAGDWLASGSVSEMTLEQQGAYARLLCYQWTKGSISADRGTVARQLGLIAEIERDLLDAVLAMFEPMPGDSSRLVNPRLHREKQETEATSQAQVLKGQARANSATRNGDGRFAPAERPAGRPAQNQPVRCQKSEKANTPASASPKLDFLAIYAAYPRKLGKSRGLKLCASRVKNAEQYSALERAVKNYSRMVEAENTEAKFVKHFDTFMGCWEDFLDPVLPAKSAACIRPVEEVLAARRASIVAEPDEAAKALIARAKAGML